MFAKLFAFLILLAVSYTGGVFFFPEIANQYGNKELNQHILELKAKLDNFASRDPTTSSLIDSAKSVAWPYVDQAKNVLNQTQDTVKQVNQVIEEKSKQVQEAKDSVENAYKAVDTAKQNIQNLGSKPSPSTGVNK